MGEDVRVVTLWQPWASLIMFGVKTIETRPWAFPSTVELPARILIHASKRAARLNDARKAWDAVGLTYDDLVATLWPGRDVCADPLPLGAVLGWVTVTDSVPMVDFEPIHPRCTPLDDHRQRAVLDVHGDELTYWWHHDAGFRDMTDQRPYGDFTPGRHGWLLADPEPFPEPIPARGAQGLWRPNRALRYALGLDGSDRG